MTKKRTYQAIPVEKFDLVRGLAELRARGERAIVAIDVAKTKMVAGVAANDGETLKLVRFSHPAETGRFLDMIKALSAAGLRVDPVMEATGTYGHALRYQIEQLGLVVYRVDAKKSHDAAMIFDGVPSHHDAKACTVLARLHQQGVSAPWRKRSDEEREARVLTKERDLYTKPLTHIHGHLEAQLAAFWPELLPLIDQSRAWHLQLLAGFPTPAQAAGKEDAVRKLLRESTRGRLSAERIEQVIAATKATVGEMATEAETRLLQVMAQQALSLVSQLRDVDRRQKEFAGRRASEPLRNLAADFGAGTAIAVVAHLGDPGTYAAPAAFEKAMGMNLAEKSSGEHDGKKHITKRGPAKVRMYLFFAALRAIQRSPIVRAWFNARASRATTPVRAIVAVMRKLARAMVHVARGNPLDFTLLFDTKKLGLAPPLIPSEPSLEDTEEELPLVIALPAELA